MILLLDIGNTTIKWAQLLDGTLTPQQTLRHRDVDVEVWMKSLFRERFRPQRMLVANVAGPAMRERIEREARRLWQITPEFAATEAHAAGVTHAYRDVSTHGVDRWLAVIAAYRLAGGAAALVVDAGTAVTIDAVDARGLHLGGVIIPGLHMMIDSLLAGTGDIARKARSIGARDVSATAGSIEVFATDTAKAVVNGASIAIAAAADRMVAQMTQRMGTAPKVYITGGDGPRIQKVMQSTVIHVPDLVLQGLAILARPSAV